MNNCFCLWFPFQERIKLKEICLELYLDNYLQITQMSPGRSGSLKNGLQVDKHSASVHPVTIPFGAAKSSSDRGKRYWLVWWPWRSRYVTMSM